MPAALGQNLLQRLPVLRQGGHADLLGHGAAALIILPQHGGQDFALVLLCAGSKHLHLPAQQIPVLQVQHAEAPAYLAPVQPPYIRVGAHSGDDLLGLAQNTYGADPVPQGGGPFKIQRFRRLLHFPLQFADDP